MGGWATYVQQCWKDFDLIQFKHAIRRVELLHVTVVRVIVVGQMHLALGHRELFVGIAVILVALDKVRGVRERKVS